VVDGQDSDKTFKVVIQRWNGYPWLR
jgi:hypothetical protein